jgi:hypothetical protein
MLFELFQTISKRRRSARKDWFNRIVRVAPNWKILDIGCGENFRSPWFGHSSNVIGIDLRWVSGGMKAYERFVCGDACHLPFPDQAFDFVYSNSLIEHLPSREHQRRFASEVNRVGRHFWIQTPNTDFPVDPHYLLPFFQHLPENWQKRTAYKLSGSWLIGGYYITRGWDVSQYEFETVLGLNSRQLRALFPSARLLHHRFVGLSQSIIAYTVPA